MKHDTFAFGKNSWEKRASLVARVVRDNAPDILGTQELVYASIGDMERLLPNYRYVGTGRAGGTMGEYSAIFYDFQKFELLGHETFWLSRTPAQPSRSWLSVFPRICTTARLQLRSDPQVVLQVYNTHLDHISYLARINGLRLILEHMTEVKQIFPEIPAILMGDFNATQTSKTLRALQQQLLSVEDFIKLTDCYHLLLKTAPDRIGRSYHGFRGAVAGKPIDYIFASRELSVQAIEIRHDNYDNVFPSDHYPVIAELHLKRLLSEFPTYSEEE